MCLFLIYAVAAAFGIIGFRRRDVYAAAACSIIYINN